MEPEEQNKANTISPRWMHQSRRYDKCAAELVNLQIQAPAQTQELSFRVLKSPKHITCCIPQKLKTLIDTLM